MVSKSTPTPSTLPKASRKCSALVLSNSIHQTQGRYGFLRLSKHLLQGNQHTNPPSLELEDTSHIFFFKGSLVHQLQGKETCHLAKTEIFYPLIAC